ncbi:MAG: DEAD/DEAH box helicase [Candidatus Omnitrophota bacterium]|jgi:ATP-dependent Lhr-like helicase|nr:MAG: DEAD/DEAH box helicase [Candidatus Omnitrophota bacterium]
MVLSIFHPIIRQWFAERIGTPTDVQQLSWPQIAAGKHVLITAPTGSGKTLTAFLLAIDRLLTGRWQRGQIRLLYISPLKALNNDIQRNLLSPLSELRDYFERENEFFPPISIQTRSGDTDPADRRRMLRHPPEILITTPESLNLLVSSVGSRKLLSGIVCVILDEIHAVAGTKRGTHLITAVDRLVPLSGEFQRIALSATVKPLAAIADFVGGYRSERRGNRVNYHKRKVSVIEAGSAKEYRLHLQMPEMEDETIGNEIGLPPRVTFWNSLIRECKTIIHRNCSTLFFTNNRRHCERISMLINQDEKEILAYSHHGSLYRETREVVEERLKCGELKAIVATGSLELGIDIGALDEVVLIQTPPSVAAALQRIGRAGHEVGRVSKGTLFPLHGFDLLEAIVMSRCIQERDIESIRPIPRPLDVLAQIIVAMTGVEKWNLDHLYDFIRNSAPYHELGRTEFDLVLKMLSGHYGGGRVRNLRPLLFLDRVDNTVQAKDGALRIVYAAGGTIPDRGYYSLRHHDTQTKIGELDEEFVWERRVGDTFIFGTQAWRILKITHNDVVVVPAIGQDAMTPFWKAEAINREFHFSEKVGLFLESIHANVNDEPLWKSWQREYDVDEQSALSLIDFLQRQKKVTQADLPHRHHLLIEYVTGSNLAKHSSQAILHTMWGGQVNRPLALALASVMENQGGNRPEIFVDNHGISLLMSDHPSIKDALLAIEPDELEHHLRKKLEQSGFFGARFRENAARALLLPRDSFGRRTPLWVNRLRSKKLLELVAKYEDFPILVETWRTCLQDEFDLATLKILLDELRTGEIRISEVHSPVPSPFSDGLLWQETNKYMYENDTPAFDALSNLGDELLQQVVFSAALRPTITRALIEQFEQKAQRTYGRYAPQSSVDLLDWIKERLWIPWPEWEELLCAMKRDHSIDGNEVLDSLHPKLLRIYFQQNQSASGVVALECLPRLLAAFPYADDEIIVASMPSGATISLQDALRSIPSPAIREIADEIDPLTEWIGQWLQFYGPKPRSFLPDTFALDETRLNDVLDSLQETRRIVIGKLSEGSTEDENCDSENLEILLRLTRKQAIPSFETLPAENLAGFMAFQQGLLRSNGNAESLPSVLDNLLLYPLPPEMWETEILPARLSSYSPAWMDALMQESGLIWYGSEQEKIMLCFQDQLELLCGEHENETNAPAQADASERAILPDRMGKYDFSQLLNYTKMTTVELTDALWNLVWRGKATNDSFAALRKGIDSRFKAWDIASDKKSGRRAGFGRWKSSRPFTGNWFALETPSAPFDAMDRLELQKEKVRVILDRYGIVFRDLLAREHPALRWGQLFKALRLMELSGEILTGYFFAGISGLQFISPSAFRSLRENANQERIFWINAMDPASLCGVALKGLNYELPKRRPTTHLVYHGNRLVLLSKRNGKDVEIRVPPNDPHLHEYYRLFKNVLERQISPKISITVETINGEDAVNSSYLSVIKEMFDVTVDYRKITLRKRFH